MSLLDNLIRLMHLKIISFIGNERKENKYLYDIKKIEIDNNISNT